MDKSLSVESLGNGRYKVTVVLPDFVGLLSVLTGLFATCGISIEGGRSDTVDEKVVDTFEVSVSEEPDWQQLEQDLDLLTKKALGGYKDEAFADINRRLVEYFRTHEEIYSDRLYPVDIKIDQESSMTETVVDIRSQDTLAFLYELTNALSLLDINIVHMQIATVDEKVNDKLWVTHEGEKITSEKKLKALQWAILLVKQFSHLLPKVPDPQTALQQFTLLGKEMFADEGFSEFLPTLKKSKTLEDLSQLLGTSRFLSEEFVRHQYESIIPVFEDEDLLKEKKSKEKMTGELSTLLEAAQDHDKKEAILNDYKDKEMFRIDLRHILGNVSYLGEFAEEFTHLVEVVLQQACEIAWQKALSKHSEPKVSADQRSEFAVFGLGKFGGRELGYASDLELLFIYSDDPDSSSENSQNNFLFYRELVSQVTKVIHAKSEGVFEIDLRLRPHGSDGPLASPLDMFKDYYRYDGGQAWNFERQALIKLRHVAGSTDLGREVEALRDSFVYSKEAFDFAEAMALRGRQQRELVTGVGLNAKYSPGGLLDVEYLIQTLQIAYGQVLTDDIRHPNTMKAMRALWKQGILGEKHFQDLRASYIFIRGIINALRIVRGNAKDLTIPNENSEDFVILGRRMGYKKENREVRAQFKLAYQHHMGVAERLYEEYMVNLANQEWLNIPGNVRHLPEQTRPSLDDLLRGEVNERTETTLRKMGFLDIKDAVMRFKRICPDTTAFEPFSKAMDKAWPLWPEVPNPNLALKHLEEFVDKNEDLYALWYTLAKSDKSLRLILLVFGSSSYLSETYIAHRDLWVWLQDTSFLNLNHTREQIEKKKDEKLSFEELRDFKHVETLRIALCEYIMGASLQEVFGTYSMLAQFILEQGYKHFFDGKRVCVLGMGKLGGDELNFSSDVDLMFISEEEEDLTSNFQGLLRFLKDGTLNEFCFRVDLRLRPHGDAGSLYLATQDMLEYYRTQAESWEYQALIKAKPVAGDLDIGWKFLEALRSEIWGESWKSEMFDRVREVKKKYEDLVHSKGEENTNIKMGPGTIRDIEFTVQMTQLKKSKEFSELKEKNTLKALDIIEEKKILSVDECAILRSGYIFFRKIENRLQLYENRQLFALPAEKDDLRTIAKSLDFYSSGQENAEDQFMRKILQVKKECRAIFEKVFFESKNNLKEQRKS